jgi:hypothetical protein
MPLFKIIPFNQRTLELVEMNITGIVYEALDRDEAERRAEFEADWDNVKDPSNIVFDALEIIEGEN